MSEQSLAPSKQFIIRGSIAISIITILLVVQTTWFKHLFKKNNSKTETPVVTTVGDAINKDTNGNSIPDWEEKLWGLDPSVLYTNGISNQKIIEDKKKVLGVTETSEENLNETDQLARQLFALTAALGQSEELDNATLKEIANKIGSSVNVKDSINQYSLKDIQTVQTSTTTLRSYYSAMQKITSAERGYTPDIEAIAAAVETEDLSTLEDFSTTAAAYKKMAKSLSAVPVPIGVAPYHLQIMNSFVGIAESFSYIEQINDNSIIALVGIATYKTHNTRLSIALINMADYLAKYGILKE